MPEIGQLITGRPVAIASVSRFTLTTSEGDGTATELSVTVGHSGMDRRAHVLEHLAHVVGERRQVLIDGLRTLGSHVCSLQH